MISDFKKNVCEVFECEECDITGFIPMEGGLSNDLYKFKVKDMEYVYRNPGKDEFGFVNRKNEKVCNELAVEHGFDSTLVYINPEEGWKISKYASESRYPDYSSKEDSKLVAQTLRKLHSLPDRLGQRFKPIEMANILEKKIEQAVPGSLIKHRELKERVACRYLETVGDGIEACFCHGDCYAPNWLISGDKVDIIDWEYAGVADPGIDVGYYIADAGYTASEAECFIKEYLGDDADEKLIFHFKAYTAVIAYFWFIWATYREICGYNVGDATERWLAAAERFSDVIL